MTIDPRTPVIVGVGQTQQRVDPADALEPIDLLAVAARGAADDAASSQVLLERVDTVAIVQIVSWPYPDPGALLARRVGAHAVRRTITTTTGGNSPQLLVNELAATIAGGGADVVLIGGAECVHTRWRARGEPKTRLHWTETSDSPCSTVIGDDRPGGSEEELAHLAGEPTQVYPLFETALRAAAGRTVEDHQRHVSELWQGFAAVAATNPHAWTRVPYTAAEIRTVSADNRMITFPYPKRMCANIDVDQAGAILLCSLQAARDAGVSDDRLVFPLAGADAHDTWRFSERWRLDESPGIRAAGRAIAAAAHTDIDDVARFDLYSCFPSAVQIAMAALGLPGPAGDDERPLTVTGGLGFAGGPANNYPTHAIAAMVGACRADPGSIGLVSALGWYCTKHSLGLYSTQPHDGPRGPFTRADADATQREIDSLPTRSTAGAYAGVGEIEATAVVHDRDGAPTVGIISALTPDGQRVLANLRDVDALRDMTRHPWEGHAARITTDGTTNTLLAP
jgi:acetyl-CoA C-acetyltransferase